MRMEHFDASLERCAGGLPASRFMVTSIFHHTQVGWSATMLELRDGCCCSQMIFCDEMCGGNRVRPQYLHLQARSVAKLADTGECELGKSAAVTYLRHLRHGRCVPDMRRACVSGFCS